jgi:hypothetical protein
MTRTDSFRALTLAAVLALGAPLTAHAAPANKGGAAQASEFVASAPVAVTRGSVDVAANTGDAAQADGNALASQAPVAQYMVGDSALANRGNGSVTSHDFGNGAQG